MHTLETLPFANSFAALPHIFYSAVTPTPLAHPHLVSFNTDAAALIGLDPAEAQRVDAPAYLSGTAHLHGAQPVAALYAGHQFGYFVPQLGDGRAILLGEVQTPHGGWELQLKGAGLTPYSRNGDGRAVLRSSIREYLCSEAIHGLGIPTTRALSIVGSADEVYREQIETAAVVMRMAPSFVRFGSFEVFFSRGQPEAIRILADYVIARHYPELVDAPDKYPLFLRAVVLATARLMAQWQAVGFAHGVMNTDNMSILGLTLDYGPFGFLDVYDPGYICNHSDQGGRYAFDQQPDIGSWNLTRLAQALTPLMEVDAAKEALNIYPAAFATRYIDLMSAKLGIVPGKDSVPLITSMLDILHSNHVDYTMFWRALCDFDSSAGAVNAPLRDLFPDRAAFDAWAMGYRTRLQMENSQDTARRDAMRRANPKYILRNHLAEIAIRRACDDHDFSEVDRLLDLLRRPFDEQPENAAYASAPPDWASHISVSCSS
ncbi:MAG TPA: YdiU family protein [Sulfuriferula sp.]|nr:YdiU family protein [Sulfuriferula sp.]